MGSNVILLHFFAGNFSQVYEIFCNSICKETLTVALTVCKRKLSTVGYKYDKIIFTAVFMVIAIKCIQLMFLQAQVFPLGMSNICDCLCPKVTLPYKNCR